MRKDQTRFLAPLLLTTVVLVGCGKINKPIARTRVTPAEKLRLAMQGEDPGDAREKLQQAKELAQWQDRRKAGIATPFDQPDGALAFYLLKRVPEGQTALDSATL